MRRVRIQRVLAVLVLGTGAARADVELDFIPDTRAHRPAAQTYAQIWKEHGARIVAALEARTCLPFTEISVAALVADATSNSGGPEHPMRLRATYPPELKQSTLVHELGHRHLWQLAERIHGVDGHETLFLVLDGVWADVWGEDFAEARIRDESAWDEPYDYAAAWDWARSLTPEGRARLWNELLARNGFPNGCRGLVDRAEP